MQDLINISQVNTKTNLFFLVLVSALSEKITPVLFSNSYDCNSFIFHISYILPTVEKIYTVKHHCVNYPHLVYCHTSRKYITGKKYPGHCYKYRHK